MSSKNTIKNKLKKNGGKISDTIKNIYNKTKKFINKKKLQFNKIKYFELFDIEDFDVSDKLLKIIKNNNINNQKFTQKILEKINEDPTFEDLIKDTKKYNMFIEKIKKMYIVKDFSIFNDYIDNNRIYSKKNIIDTILLLERVGLFMVLFDNKIDNKTISLLVKPIQNAFDDFYSKKL